MADRIAAKGALAVIATAAVALTSCNPLAPPARSHPKPVAPPVSSTTTRTHPTPTPTPTATPTTTPTQPPTGTATDVYEARILVLVNAERTSRGLSALTASSCADGFAESWAPVLQHNAALSHQSLSPIMTSCHAFTAGENVAYGNVKADQMMAMWMNSPGHRANILSASYTSIGIAAVTDSGGRWYGVQDFIGS